MYVVMSPFSAFNSREWPADRFADLSNALHAVGVGTVVVGGPAHAYDLQRHFGHTWATWHYGQPPEFVAKLIGGAACVIGNDSGIVHYAGLLGAKAVAVHAGSLPHDYLFADAPTVASVTAGEPLPRSDHNTPALHSIAVETVLRAVGETIGVDVAMPIARRRTLLGGKLDVLLRLLADVPAGDVAELGVYRGGSTAAMALAAPDRTVHAFDTFGGMPAEATSAVDVHRAGEFADNADTLDYLAGFPNVVTHAGLFPATAAGLDEQRFAFVHLDADQYASTLSGLQWLWPRLVAGGVMVLDDWQWPNCPGVEKAVREYFGEVPAAAEAIGNQLVLRK